MIYSYFAKEDNYEVDAQQEIDTFAQSQGWTIDQPCQDEDFNKVHWSKRALFSMVGNLKAGDKLLTYEVSNLACSTLQLLEILEQLVSKKVELYVVKYSESFKPLEETSTSEFLKFIQHIEADFVAKRTTDALARRRLAGLPLGRPKGRKNKSRKLDVHKPEIKKYLGLNISKASIAKLVGCHAQTLYNYIDDMGLVEEVQKEQQGQVSQAESQES